MLRSLSVLCCASAMLATLSAFAAPPSSHGPPPDPWQAAAPRDELRPAFSWTNPDGDAATLVIQCDDREGLDGYWTRTFAVQGGTHYQFRALRRVDHVANPRRSCLVRLAWLDAHGKKVSDDRPVVERYDDGASPTAEVEHPRDRSTDAAGWAEVADVYRAPRGATQASVELHLMWAPGGRVEWRDISLDQTEALRARNVRLATVHFRPRSQSTADGCRQFAPLIEAAARQGADLVVLPETLTYYATGRSVIDVAEPIPGPATDYFGTLARAHNLYLVVGLYERAEHLIYNVAVLIGPDGKVVGTYRKVTLPTGEIEQGITPGTE